MNAETLKNFRFVTLTKTGPLEETTQPAGLPAAPPVCECGTEKAGGGIHSGWCPLGAKP